jgi:DNA-binding Xre family transcriptional regulator
MSAITEPVGLERIDVVVGVRLVMALDARMISKADLSQHLSQPIDMIEQFCRGDVRIGPSRLLAICELLDVSVGWFFAE